MKAKSTMEAGKNLLTLKTLNELNSARRLEMVL
jgi:hypothetical protein